MQNWIPAFAGMTVFRVVVLILQVAALARRPGEGRDPSSFRSPQRKPQSTTATLTSSA